MNTRQRKPTVKQDTVTIPRSEYDSLIDSKTRLAILEGKRIHEIDQENSDYVREEDYILGSYVMMTLIGKQTVKKLTEQHQAEKTGAQNHE